MPIQRISPEWEEECTDLFNKVRAIEEEGQFTFAQLRRLYRDYRKHLSSYNIPLSIFADARLSPMESIVKYLRENCRLSFREIAKLLDKKETPIGITYRRAQKKHPGIFSSACLEFIPVSLFHDTKTSSLSVFEKVVYHLRGKGMKLSEISLHLGKNPRTVWTVYHRANKKLSKGEL